MNIDTPELDKQLDSIEKEIGETLKGTNADTIAAPSVATLETKSPRPTIATTVERADRTRYAMKAASQAEAHIERQIEAAIEEAVIVRVMQMRGKLDLGPNDIYARQRALEWILSINTGNAQDKPT